MDYTTWTVDPSGLSESTEHAVLSLYPAFQGLPDARRAQGKRYELAVIFCLLVLAKLAGQKTLGGATQWIGHRGRTLAQCFGLRRAQMPCQMTYCNVLARLDSVKVDELLSAFFTRWEAQSRCGDEPSRLQTPQGQADHRQLAFDGKTIHAPTSQAHPVHQLSCDEVATGIGLWHCNVQEKEISALKPGLNTEGVTGRMVRLDAMHTQPELCIQVHRLKGDDLLIGKREPPHAASRHR